MIEVPLLGCRNKHLKKDDDDDDDDDNEDNQVLGLCNLSVGDFLVGSSLPSHSFIFSSVSRIQKPENYISQASLLAWVRFYHGEARTETREKSSHQHCNYFLAWRR